MADRKDVKLPGGIYVSGVTADEAKVLEGRGKFAQQYCAEKGWNFDQLTITQLLEIRAQDGWKNPA